MTTVRSSTDTRALSVVQGTLIAGPETLQINLRNGCNLNCDFCWNHSPFTSRPPPRWHREELSDRHLRAIIEALPRLAPSRVLLSGRGEPLLHAGAERLLTALFELGIPVTVQTNGIAGPSPARLVELRVARLLVNVSAGTAASYAVVHPGRGRLFDDVVARLRTLADHPAPRPHVRLLAVVHERNRDQIVPMVELAAEVGAPSVMLKGMEHRDDALSRLRMSEVGRAQIREDLVRAERLANERGVELDATHLWQVVREQRTDRAFTAGLATGPCYMGWYYLRVTVDGRVMFCCKDKEVDHLERRPLDRIWRSAGYHLLRLGGRDRDLGVGLFDAKCRTCSNFVRNRQVAVCVEAARDGASTSRYDHALDMRRRRRR